MSNFFKDLNTTEGVYLNIPDNSKLKSTRSSSRDSSKRYKNNLSEIMNEQLVKDLTLDELKYSIAKVQEEILKLSNERKLLQTLPKNKKNMGTLKKCTAISIEINKLQMIMTQLGSRKKKIRDVMQQERDWLRAFYKEVCGSNKWLKRKLISTVDEKMGYSIDLSY